MGNVLISPPLYQAPHPHSQDGMNMVGQTSGEQYYQFQATIIIIYICYLPVYSRSVRYIGKNQPEVLGRTQDRALGFFLYGAT